MSCICGIKDTVFENCSLFPGIREVVVCKDKNGRVGMCLLAESKGIFVGLVKKDTPAAMAGLRFGDQILSVSDSDWQNPCAAECQPVITR